MRRAARGPGLASTARSLSRWATGALAAALLAPAGVVAQQRPTDPSIARSDEHARVLLEVLAEYGPEAAARLGVEGRDSAITVLSAGYVDRLMEAMRGAKAELEQRLAAETDPRVRQDLEILTDAAERNIRGAELGLRYALPFFQASQAVFGGLRGLLDERVPAERRAAALVRLRRYTGMEPGYEPFTELARARIRERLADTTLIGPFRGEVEQYLQNSAAFLSGIPQLFQQFGLHGYEEPVQRLREQVEAYDAFVRAEVLPRAREDFRLPPEIYAHNLRQVGVDLPVDQLMSRAKTSFREIQNEMQALAPLVAKERGWAMTDYRDVIRELKKEQLEGEAILPFYQERIERLEELVREHDVVTLPQHPTRIRLASEAESAAQPAPNMSPPRLIGNTGETGEFVLPLRVPSPAGENLAYDDFTFDAAAWTLTVHEARPGHELQFSRVVENGVSVARAIFARNSVNTEGWALYAEAEMRPYLPLDGQLISLQHRLLRAARAFLDPGLQIGEVTPERAREILMEDGVFSPAMARQEVDRYTFRAPGQATSYFYGYQKLMELRTDVERALGDRFDRQAYHDFLLAQGFLPPALLRRAVMEGFVPAQLAGAGD